MSFSNIYVHAQVYSVHVLHTINVNINKISIKLTYFGYGAHNGLTLALLDFYIPLNESVVVILSNMSPLFKLFVNAALCDIMSTHFMHL